jgi:hypothetical protein
VDSAIFLKKIGSGMHRVTQNSVRDGEVSVISMPGKKIQNTILACVLLRSNFWNSVLACSIAKIPMHVDDRK